MARKRYEQNRMDRVAEWRKKGAQQTDLTAQQTKEDSLINAFTTMDESPIEGFGAGASLISKVEEEDFLNEEAYDAYKSIVMKHLRGWELSPDELAMITPEAGVAWDDMSDNQRRLLTEWEGGDNRRLYNQFRNFLTPGREEITGYKERRRMEDSFEEQGEEFLGY